MKTIRKLKKNQKGSILILTMLALVGALSIAVAMSSISIVERKITTKSRKSVTAFQSANSGMEWAMKKINDAEVGDTIADIFGAGSLNAQGEVDCVSNLFSDSKLNCKITLLGADGHGNRIPIMDDTHPMEDIIAIRSSGTYGEDIEQVGRALEAYAMPNCGSDERVADFCIETTSNVEKDWNEAVEECTDGGKRLCTAAEVVATEHFSSDDFDGSLTADLIDASNYIFVDDDGDLSSESLDASKEFYCCRNR